MGVKNQYKSFFFLIYLESEHKICYLYKVVTIRKLYIGVMVYIYYKVVKV